MKRHTFFPARFLSAVVCVAVLVVVTGCSSPPSTPPPPTAASPPPGGKVLRVGMTPTMPPMIFKQAGQYVGLEADFARGLAADMGRELKFVELGWEQLLDALLGGKIDIIMSGMSITQARQVRMDFARPYLRAGQVALVRREDLGKLQLFLTAPETRVGYQQGTTGEYYVKQNMTRNRQTGYRDAQGGANALIAKKIDAFIHDAAVNWWLASENEQKGLVVLSDLLVQEYLAWGVRKGDSGLVAAANQYLEKQNASGELRRLVTRWLPQFGAQ